MSFDYDRPNRLTQSKRQDNNWSIGYAYDRWGNRLSALVQSGSPPGFIPQAGRTLRRSSQSVPTSPTTSQPGRHLNAHGIAGGGQSRREAPKKKMGARTRALPTKSYQPALGE